MTEPDWTPILGWEGLYEVSINLQQVRSVARTVMRSNGVPQRVRERILMPRTDRKGYLYVNLWRDGTYKSLRLHRLVYEAYHGATLDPLIRHFDDDKTNNTISNLMPGNYSDNGKDAVRNGRNVNANKECCPKCGGEYSDSKWGRFCYPCKIAYIREWKRKRRASAVQSAG